MSSSTPAPGRALVTGASSGIGAALARELARRGPDLVLVARRKERLDDLAVELGRRHRVSVEVLPADLTDEAGLALVEERLRDDAAPVDLLANNAGFGTDGLFAELAVEREAELVALNVTAVLRLTHAALGGMLQRGRGAVLNVGSTAGFQPLPGSATYAASKAFVNSFSEALAEETRGTGVRVCVSAPGPVRTEFGQVAGADGDLGKVPSWVWREPADVAVAALDALAAGRVYSVPGLPMRVVEVAVGLLPKSVVRRVAGLRLRLL